MATVEEELKPDTVPSFKPLGEEESGLFARMKARQSKGTPLPPKPPKSEPKTTSRKVTGTGKSIHERRANKIANMVGSLAMGASVVAVFAPHKHVEVIDGKRIQVPDRLYLDDAKAINDGATLVGETWATWADQNPKLGEWIDKLSAGGAGAMAIASLFAIVVPIMANHGIIPEAMAAQFTPAAVQALMDRLKAQEEQGE